MKVISRVGAIAVAGSGCPPNSMFAAETERGQRSDDGGPLSAFVGPKGARGGELSGYMPTEDQ